MRAVVCRSDEGLLKIQGKGTDTAWRILDEFAKEWHNGELRLTSR